MSKNDYWDYLGNASFYDNSLMHYGVLGMKWGHHKARQYDRALLESKHSSAIKRIDSKYDKKHGKEKMNTMRQKMLDFDYEYLTKADNDEYLNDPLYLKNPDKHYEKARRDHMAKNAPDFSKYSKELSRAAKRYTKEKANLATKYKGLKPIKGAKVSDIYKKQKEKVMSDKKAYAEYSNRNFNKLLAGGALSGAVANIASTHALRKTGHKKLAKVNAYLGFVPSVITGMTVGGAIGDANTKRARKKWNKSHPNDKWD